jgi:hypothetical protein
VIENITKTRARNELQTRLGMPPGSRRTAGAPWLARDSPVVHCPALPAPRAPVRHGPQAARRDRFHSHLGKQLVVRKLLRGERI